MQVVRVKILKLQIHSHRKAWKCLKLSSRVTNNEWSRVKKGSSTLFTTEVDARTRRRMMLKRDVKKQKGRHNKSQVRTRTRTPVNAGNWELDVTLLLHSSSRSALLPHKREKTLQIPLTVSLVFLLVIMSSFYSWERKVRENNWQTVFIRRSHAKEEDERCKRREDETVRQTVSWKTGSREGSCLPSCISRKKESSERSEMHLQWK